MAPDQGPSVDADAPMLPMLPALPGLPAVTRPVVAPVPRPPAEVLTSKPVAAPAVFELPIQPASAQLVVGKLKWPAKVLIAGMLIGAVAAIFAAAQTLRIATDLSSFLDNAGTSIDMTTLAVTSGVRVFVMLMGMWIWAFHIRRRSRQWAQRPPKGSLLPIVLAPLLTLGAVAAHVFAGEEITGPFLEWLAFLLLMGSISRSASTMYLRLDHRLTWVGAYYLPTMVNRVVISWAYRNLSSLGEAWNALAVVTAALAIGVLLQAWAAARTALDFEEAFARAAAGLRPLTEREHQIRKGRRIGRGKVALAASGTLLVGGVVPVVAEIDAYRAAAPEFDDRLESLADYATKERGLEFIRHVPVKFYASAEFDALLGGSEEDLVSTTAAVYVPELEVVAVRGTELTAEDRAVVVHELVHALQDQHFDVDIDDDNELELRSVLEGDAMRVQQAYLTSLGELTLVEEASFQGLDGEAVSDLKDPLSQETLLAYLVGEALVAETFERGGNEAVNDLLETLPTERQLLNPWQTGFELGDRVTVEPAVPPGITDVSEVRPSSLFREMHSLDEWLSYSTTRAAFENWRGGSFVTYTHLGVTCRAVIADIEGSTLAYIDALTQWAAASGNGAVPQLLDSDTVHYTACPPLSAPPQSAATTLMGLAMERSASVYFPEMSPDQALCTVRYYVDVNRNDGASLDAAAMQAAVACPAA